MEIPRQADLEFSSIHASLVLLVLSSSFHASCREGISDDYKRKVVKMNQNIIDRAVNIATRAALNGHPVKRIVWIPPSSACQDTGGSFGVETCPTLRATETAPWDK